MVRRWALIFGGTSAALLLAVYGLIWTFNGFQGLGLDFDVALALTLGTVASAALGVGLMGLMFYSDRSGRDDDVHDAGMDHRS